MPAAPNPRRSTALPQGTSAAAIADSVEAALRTGRLGPGDRLPPIRQLSQELGVSPATVAAAYSRLRNRGLVVAKGRGGTRIADRPPVAWPEAGPVVPAPTTDAVDLTHGRADPDLLPPLDPALAAVDRRPHLYGEPSMLSSLGELARRSFDDDGVASASVTVVSGALDGIERILGAHLRPGDRVLVEDPGYPPVTDLLRALGLIPVGVRVDDDGPEPEALAAALASAGGVTGRARRPPGRRMARSGPAAAIILTPRAHNPTGAALSPTRAAAVRSVLDAHHDVLVIEDDHAGPVAGPTGLTAIGAGRARWARVLSVSKWLGPDLRVAVVAGDASTIGRVQGRQAVGPGWVSHLLQGLVVAMWSDPATPGRLARARDTYAARRAALLEALAQHEIEAHGRSGMNVWIPVVEEAVVVSRLLTAGWAVRAGERFRLQSGPGIRITAATLPVDEAPAVAAAVADALPTKARGRVS